VKRTADAIAIDHAAVPQVSTEVRTERIEQGHFTALGPKKHQISTEVMERQHATGL
jgi:hypothetical protein